MSRLTERKSRLEFETAATARYRGKERSVVVEVLNPYIATVRLAGTRTRYEISWRGVFDYAAELHVRRERERRKAERKARRAA